MKHVVNLTKSAISKLEKINEKNILLRVKSGGCNGFSYEFLPINTFSNLDEKITFNNFNLYICNKSIFHVLGTTIDWKEDIMGTYFHFENPNATSKCGCGTSFTI
tara:strand:+ start:2229 stop:2543 length:315 start_codon:yes stop_codon:yes gene_type:complete